MNGGSKESTKIAVEAELLRKADGANTDTSLTPRPPHLVGREAWDQALSSSFILRTSVRMSLSVLLTSLCPDEANTGDVRRRYCSLGMPKHTFRR